MIVSIMQPAYLPWLGYFDRIAQSDRHVVLDTVRIDHNTKTQFTNRNRVLTANGPVWLTVPISTSGRQDHLRIADIEVARREKWQRKHWETIRQSYRRAPYFEHHEPFLSECFSRDWVRLSPLLDFLTEYLLHSLGITTPLVRSSALPVSADKSDLVLQICCEVGAQVYISGPFGRDYLDLASFERAGIEVRFQNYQHPSYTQLHPGFEPYMSVIDLLLNHGPDSLGILRNEKAATP